MSPDRSPSTDRSHPTDSPRWTRRRLLTGAAALTATSGLARTARGSSRGRPAPAGPAAPADPAGRPTGAGPAVAAWRRQAGAEANPYLAGNFAPVAEEITARNLTVRGQIPAGLHGSFLRQGPNPHAVTDPARHAWFPGDGMIHAIELREGTAVAYRNRYVRTTTMSDALGEPRVPGPDPVGFDGSNTNVAPFAGRILSVTETSLPYVVTADARTLERVDLGGRLTHGLSAHCKYDPAAGELHNVSYRIGAAPFAVWQVLSADGSVSEPVPIDLDVAGMWHTFSITDRFVVVYDHPIVFDAQRLADGWLFPFAWHPERDRRVGLIDRAGDGSVRWLDAPGMNSVNHDIGAHDTHAGLTVYYTSSTRQFDADQRGPLEAPPTLERMDIDVASGRVDVTTVSDLAQEFPRANPALGLGAARYVYAVGNGPGVSGGGVLEAGNAIIKHDLETGRTVTAPMGAARATAEAVFIPDPERAAVEDGGWLVSFVYDATTDRSDFVITDAEDITAAPLATIELPVRVPYGFHGNWIAAG